MNPPKLAIVTSLCKGSLENTLVNLQIFFFNHNQNFEGNTLYTHLHLRRDKFSMSKLIVIAQQICQGMSLSVKTLKNINSNITFPSRDGISSP